MKHHQIKAQTKRSYLPHTTDSRHAQPIASNVLDRQFIVDQPNQKWAADITYLRTDEGWLYLSAVIDLCTRKIVGWSMANHLRTELTTDALQMALDRRQPAGD